MADEFNGKTCLHKIVGSHGQKLQNIVECYKSDKNLYLINVNVNY